MARFSLLNPVIRKVGQKYDINGKPEGPLNTNVQNAGNEYLYAMLINDNCPWEGTQVYTSFQPNVVAVFKPLLSIDKGGSAETDQPIPEQFTKLNGCYVTWTSPQPFYKKHLSAHPANPRTGTPAIKAGDLVKSNGVPVIFTELTVFCQYYFNEMNEKQWMKGCTPEEVGRRAMQNYCVLCNDAAQVQAEMKSEQQVEIVDGQPVQAVSPKPAAQAPFIPQGQAQSQQGQQPQFTQQPQQANSPF